MVTILLKLESYKNLFDEGIKFKSKKRERSIFSIGGRGHYENPISDIMAFLLDPMEEHPFKTLLLQSFFNCASGISVPDLITVSSVEREVVTNEGYRIDILVEGEDWVLVIENKIYHTLSNPLLSYESYITEEYPNKNKYFAILSITPYEAPNWCGLTYCDLLIEAEKLFHGHLEGPTDNKWVFLLREFLLNIKELIGEGSMDKDQLLFIRGNYSKIQELIKIKENYIMHLIQEISKKLSEKGSKEIKGKVNNWGDGRSALRFYSFSNWHKQSNLVMVLNADGSFEVRAYVYDVSENQRASVDKHFLLDNYTRWVEQQTINCYKTKSSYQYDDALEEMLKMAQQFNKYYV